MAARHWKVSHIASIAFMAGLLLFFVFTAIVGESSPLLSSTAAQAAAAEQTTGDFETAGHASQASPAFDL